VSRKRANASDGVVRELRTEAVEMPDRSSAASMTILRFPAVRARTGLSRVTVWRLEQRGEFPKHLKLSSHIVGWLETDIAEWIRSRIEQVGR
jgi:prophage regulatory protein